MDNIELEYIPIDQGKDRMRIQLEIIVDTDGYLDIRPIEDSIVATDV